MILGSSPISSLYDVNSTRGERRERKEKREERERERERGGELTFATFSRGLRYPIREFEAEGCCLLLLSLPVERNLHEIVAFLSRRYLAGEKKRLEIPVEKVHTKGERRGESI